MDHNNEEVIYSSEKCKITKGEYNGKQCIKKTCNFSREAVNMIARINSPYISHIYEIGDDYIISEYVNGADLSKSKISPKNVLSIALELCDALAELHKNSVIYRDIKPSNIILCDDGHIKLIDFDAARIKKTTTDKDTVFIGTDGFAPPEQFGFTQTDERSDIYAFGITVKLLLGENYARSCYKSVIEKCIRFDPARRYKTITAVKAALARSKYLRFAVPCAAVLAVAATVPVMIALFNSAKFPSGIASVSENNSQSTNISETTSSGTSIIDTIYYSENRDVLWDMLALPNDFPKLADAVTDYSVSPMEYTAKNKICKMQYIISWQKMNDAEFDDIKGKLKTWLGTTDDGVFSEDDITEKYDFTTDRYAVSLQKIYGQRLLPHIFGNSDDYFQGYISIEEYGNDLKLPSFGCSFADPSAQETGDRPLRWEDTVLNGKIPKLSDSVTEVKKAPNGGYTIIWDEISIGELGCVLQKIVDWTDVSQCLQNFVHDSQLYWSIPYEDYNITVDYELGSIVLLDTPRLRVYVNI